MTAYRQKEIHELERSLNGREIEIVGRIAPQSVKTHSPSSFSHSYSGTIDDLEKKHFVNFESILLTFWNFKFERALEKACQFPTLKVIARGTYEVEESTIIDFSKPGLVLLKPIETEFMRVKYLELIQENALSLVDNREGTLSINEEEGNLSFKK